MIKLFKECINLTNKYIVIATPLILFSLISSLYILFSGNGTNSGLIIAIFLCFLMLCAFISGWFYIIKKCIKEPDIDPNALITEFPAGVGEYFLPTLGLTINSLILSSIIFLGAYLAGMKLIGDIGLSANTFSVAVNSVESLKTVLASLTNEQLIKLNEWNILLFGAMCLTYFLIMFYSPAMFFKNKNPFKALFTGLKDLFSFKFFKNCILFITIFLFYTILSILTAIFGSNIIMHFVMTLANFYFLVFAAMCIFKYYYTNFVQIGGTIDTRV